MRQIIASLLFAAAMASSVPAEAKHFRYLSRHPGHGGFCPIGEPHVHRYAPSDVRLYRMVGGDYYFVGDPVPFGYDGPRYAYYDAHPVVETNVHFGEPVYCYLEGPHYHWYAPPPRAHFEIRAGINWYVGTFEPIYYRHEPRYVVVNEVYRPIRYQRPAVVVTDAPPGWRGRPSGRRAVAPPAPPPQQGWVGTPPRQQQGWAGTPPPPQGWTGAPPAPPAARAPVIVAPASGTRWKGDHDGRRDHGRGDHGGQGQGRHRGDHGRGHKGGKH